LPDAIAVDAATGHASTEDSAGATDAGSATEGHDAGSATEGHDAGSATEGHDAGGATEGHDAGATSSAQPNGVPGTWTLIFDDEMNGTALDTTKWSTGWFGTGITSGVAASEDDCYDPVQVVEANGELDLNLIAKQEQCGGTTKDYATGFVTTNGLFSYAYGFVEARIWLPGSGSIVDWPSFWQDGQDWPANGELDVLEGLSGSACAHWHGPTGDGTGYGPNGGSGCPGGTFTGGWHTFGADWEPGIVTWYYDGQSIGCVESAGSDCGGQSHDATITGDPQYLILGLGVGSPAVAPATQRNDYVRVWQH
jgi:beta-glucanase (GH16 family)